MTCCRKHTMILGDSRLFTFDIVGTDEETGTITAEWRLCRNAETVRTGLCTVDRATNQITCLIEPETRGRHYLDVTMTTGRETKTERVFLNVV